MTTVCKKIGKNIRIGIVRTLDNADFIAMKISKM